MDGYEFVDKETHCVHLQKTIYGLVQAAREWWKKLKSILVSIGFKGGDVDPCLFYLECEKGIVYIGLYVDDCLCVGHEEAIDFVIEEMKKKGLTVKIEDNLNDYLNCNI